MLNNVTQTGNTVAGDIVGRDKIINYNAQATAMTKMIERYRDEAQKSPQIKDMEERLKRWTASADVIGLEQKLSDGNRDDLLEFARSTKDAFAKELLKNSNSAAAQEIYAHLLAKLYVLYNTLVYTKIKRGAPHCEIDDALAQKVYSDIEGMLEENPLKLDCEQIAGMLFWLTGNCHIKWS